MGNLKAFLKQNKKAKKTTQFAATKSLCDENGDPLLWTIRPLSTKESAAIRDECTIEVPVTGKPGLYRQKVNTDELLRKMICAAVVEPDLHNAELQDSYGVMSAEALIVEMVDNPEESSVSLPHSCRNTAASTRRCRRRWTRQKTNQWRRR